MLAFCPNRPAASSVLGLLLSLWTRITAIRCAEQSADDGSSEVKGAVGDLLQPVQWDMRNAFAFITNITKLPFTN